MERRKELEELEKKIRMNMLKIKHKLVIMSGKGGVGKSTFTANLGVAFAHQGTKVGILDADIHGPSIPKILGMRGKRLRAGPIEELGIFPAEGPLGIKVISMDFLLPEDETPVIWRGPMKMVAIRQFLADVNWGDLDLLLVDLPPGTGDEPLSIMQLISDIDGVLMVTAPSQLSQIVVKRAIGFTKELKIPLVGVVENMSGFICPKCSAEFDILGNGGGEKISRQCGVPFLGKIPIDPAICQNSDDGDPFILKNATNPSARAFLQVVEKIKEYLEQRGARA